MQWFPFQLSNKQAPSEGPHYAGYNERAIATTLDLIAFLFVMLQPIFWAEAKLKAYFQPYVDFGVFDRLQPLAAGLDWFGQGRLALEGFIASGMWKVFLSTNMAAILLVMIPYVGCLIIFKTTPGKWLMGVKITRSDHERFPASWQIILRSVVAIISCIPFMAGLFWMVFDKQSRTWHDMVAGTRVVTTRPEGWYWNKIKQGFRWLRTQIFGGSEPPPPSTP